MIDKPSQGGDIAALLAIIALLLLSLSMRKREPRVPRPVPMRRKRPQWQPIRLLPSGWMWDARRGAPAGWVPWMEAPIKKMKRWRWLSPRVFGVIRMEQRRERPTDALAESMARRSDGSAPPWIERGSTKSPAEQFVEWFNAIWHSGDPDGWDASAFTEDAVAIDPWGVSTGSEDAASTMLRMLRHFPELRGEVISWASNADEVFVEWRLRLQRAPERPPLLTTVADRFRFSGGRIGFRSSNFDLVNLTAYLAEAGHRGEIYEFYSESLERRSEERSVRVIPRTLRSALAEFWRWRVPEDRSGLHAIPGDGSVALEWRRRDQAISYQVYRATSMCGPYQLTGETETNRYIDSRLSNGTVYWYVVAARLRHPKFLSVRREKRSAESLRVGGGG